VGAAANQIAIRGHIVNTSNAEKIKMNILQTRKYREYVKIANAILRDTKNQAE
jgi:hypothetical protein